MAEAKGIKLNDNDTGLKVFVNGDPDLSFMPDKNKTNRGLTTYFWLIRRCARGLYVWY